MTDYDEIMRAFARINSIKENIPEKVKVSEDWVIEYHAALDQVEKEIGKSLSEFRVSKKSLKQSLASFNTITGTKSYREGLWCDRSILLQKVDAVLTCMQLLLKPEDRRIGFRE